MRIAIYARVSTDDKGQAPENQLRELRAWCANAGHTIAHEYIDHESGRKGAKGRKQFAQLFEDAHKRKFDCVLFWALDRFTREGMAATVMYLQRLAGHGVSFHSYTEAHLSTDNELSATFCSPSCHRWPRWSRRRSASEPALAWPEPERKASTSAVPHSIQRCSGRSPNG